MSTVIMTTLENGKATSVVVEKSGAEVKVNGEVAKVTAAGDVLSPLGTPYTVTNGWPSELESLLRGVVGKDQGKANPTQTEAPREDPTPLAMGKRHDIPYKAAGMIYEVKRASSNETGDVAMFVGPIPAGAKPHLSVTGVGTLSGDLNSLLEISVGAKGAPGQSRPTQADGFQVESIRVKEGEYLNVYVHVNAGGDPNFHFRVHPQA